MDQFFSLMGNLLGIILVGAFVLFVFSIVFLMLSSFWKACCVAFHIQTGKLKPRYEKELVYVEDKNILVEKKKISENEMNKLFVMDSNTSLN